MPQNPFDKFRQPQKQQEENPFDKFRGQGAAPSAPAQPAPAQEESTLEWLKRQAGIGYDRGATALADVLAGAGEVAGGIATGDFRPLLERAEGAARGLISAGAMAGYAPGVAVDQQVALEALRRRQAARRAND